MYNIYQQFRANYYEQCYYLSKQILFIVVKVSIRIENYKNKYKNTTKYRHRYAFSRNLI
jgi:hypothetical protein